jgi:hypothetical protein
MPWRLILCLPDFTGAGQAPPGIARLSLPIGSERTCFRKRPQMRLGAVLSRFSTRVSWLSRPHLSMMDIGRCPATGLANSERREDAAK